MALFKVVATEIERLNKKGEYIKEIVQTKTFLGISYNVIVNKTVNKITQKVLDETGTSSAKDKGIGF